MTDTITAYPLQWPAGWRRTPDPERTRAQFNKKVAQYRTNTQTGAQERSWDRKTELSIADSTSRVLAELERMGMDRQDIVISTNLKLRLDGLPRSDQRAPDDPGAAVYWSWRRGRGMQTRCMAIDRYDRVADNLAAIAATLEAMRSIERHGGATILDRAFTGFTALPAPEQWFTILGVSATATPEQIEDAYRRLAMKHHPDRPGGNEQEMQRVNGARQDGLERSMS